MSGSRCCTRSPLARAIFLSRRPTTSRKREIAISCSTLANSRGSIVIAQEASARSFDDRGAEHRSGGADDLLRHPDPGRLAVRPTTLARPASSSTAIWSTADPRRWTSTGKSGRACWRVWRASSTLSIAVVGGGATGVELTAELIQLTQIAAYYGATGPQAKSR